MGPGFILMTTSCLLSGSKTASSQSKPQLRPAYNTHMDISGRYAHLAASHIIVLSIIPPQ
jgi:hypothetical protein